MSDREIKLTKVVLTLALCMGLWQVCLERSMAKGASAASIPAWVIHQSSKEAGPVMSEISKNAIHVSLTKYGWVFIAKAPDWSILFLNQKTNNFVELSKQQWERKILLLQSSKKFTNKIDLLSKPTGRTMKIANLQASEYIVERAQNSSANERVAEVWTSLDIQAPPPVAELISKLMRLPDCKGIPLKAYWKSNGQMIPVLETVDVKQKSVSDATFERNKDWRQVQDQLQVMFGQPADKDTDKSKLETQKLK